MFTTLLLASLAPMGPALQDDPSQVTAPSVRPTFQLQYDSPEHARGLAPASTLQRLPAPPSWNEPEAPLSVQRSRAAEAPKADVQPTATFRSKRAIRELMTDVFVSEPGDGRVWVRGRDYRASFGTEGFTFLPVFGKAAPHEFPVEFAVRRAMLGGETLQSGVQAVQQGDSRVSLSHPGFREVYNLTLDGVEQTFVFDTLNGAGDLVVELEVGTELQLLEDADGLHFVHETLGFVTYGDAFVFDATGRRSAIARTWTGDGIELRVPAAFVADAVLPLTIDPVVNAWTNNFGVNDDSKPDICYDGQGNQYWVVWQEFTSAANADCFVTSFNSSGVQGNAFAVETTTDDWQEPKIAYHYNSNRLLVVASENPNGSGRIQGQLIDAGARSLVGTEFLISSIGFPKINPDVGGNNWDNATNSYFCVVWSFQAAAGNHDVQYRIVNWDGTLATSTETVENTADDTIHTSISETHGDGDLIGDYWTIAWMRDTNSDGLGQIHARRVVWSGVNTLGAGNFVVDSATNCAWPSVTSRLDDNFLVAGINDRPAIIAYERDFPTAANPLLRQRSLYARVTVDGATASSVSINGTVDGSDAELDQRDCHIATDGSAWYLGYSEIWFGNPQGSDYDTYYCSGHVTRTTTSAFIALAERHVNMSFSGSPERSTRVATVWDGESASISDDAAAVWERNLGANGGELNGTTIDIPTIDVSTRIAVGRQYCSANDHSGGSVFGIRNSWMWIEGDQTLTGSHFARCIDVPANTFGLLVTSRTTANVNLAGGGLGRLCLANAGRYLNSIQNSGTSRTFNHTVDPTALPTPNAIVAAAAGETWYFQYWHRDIDNGMPSSNFSNGASVTFGP